MKLATLFAAVAFAEEVADDTWVGPDAPGIARLGGDRSLDASGERRYEDLKAIAEKYWRKQVHFQQTFLTHFWGFWDRSSRLSKT